MRGIVAKKIRKETRRAARAILAERDARRLRLAKRAGSAVLGLVMLVLVLVSLVG